ncbi:tyrosine-type recombinase/integrase [Flavobacterium sp. CYK-4]|nr:tyrosine-type recombinase/integrase [Flavobacterium lotistagni]
MAKAAIYLKCVPTKAKHAQVEQYLFHLYESAPDSSHSFFKFAVYGLRFAYKMEGLLHRYHQLPSIKRNKKLPVVLSRNEVKRLLDATRSIKHKVLIGLLYGCGLRATEARHVELCDIDFDRRMLHVRHGKGNKDRYVPISIVLLGWIKEYIKVYHPQDLLLYGGQNRQNPAKKVYSPRGFYWVVAQVSQKAKITKRTTSHTLRHTFATHLLEEGLDIVSIKELLGHARIETTMVYLHVAQYDRYRPYSPLDTLYRQNQEKQPNACELVQHIRECDSCRDVGLTQILQPELVG